MKVLAGGGARWGAERSRRALTAAAGLVSAGAMVAAELLGGSGPTSTHPGVILRWYDQNAAALGWRAGLLAVAAVGVVAFATSFRELTWSLVPERLWSGTIMVLAALGYAALTSVAAAVELAVLRILPTGQLEPGIVAFAWSTYVLLLGVATPALVVVLLGTTLPFVRLSLPGQVTAMGAVLVCVLLAIPLTWGVGRQLTALWFLVAAGVVAWPTHPEASVKAIAEARRASRGPDGGGADLASAG